MEYNNSKVNEAMSLQAQTADRGQRKNYLWTVQEEMVRDLPIIPLSTDVAPQLINPEWYNLPGGPMGGFDRYDRVFWAKGTAPGPVVSTVTVSGTVAGMDSQTFAVVVVVIAIIIAGLGFYVGRKRRP
jgi:ABC-type transport system substrate-binding protein